MSCIAIGIAASVAANCFGVIPVDTSEAYPPERIEASRSTVGTCDVFQTSQVLPAVETIVDTGAGVAATATVGAVVIRRRRT
ncbi:MAG: hypothetical protein AAGI53_07805 [Planctomycetota bacterium]